MIVRSLFDPVSPDRPPGNDAAPLAGGAGVNDQRTSPHLTALPPIPPAHHNAPPGTSQIAARRTVSRAPTQRARVHALIRESGADGLTDDEGEALLGLCPQSYTPRRGELVKCGLVVDSERRRNTGSGCPAAVWIVPEYVGQHSQAGEGVTQ